MNSKKAKAIRRLVRSMGHVKAEFPMHHYDMKGRLVPASSFSALFGGVTTARYPENSFQRVHSAAKRMLRRVGMDVIRVQTAANLARG